MTNERTVIVVDDDDAVRDSLKILLESADFITIAYDSGHSFLKGHQRGSVACLLLDVRLPDMNGLDLQQALKNENIDLPVIVMTGYADVSLAVRAMKAGAVDFIEKPIDRVSLLASINDAFDFARAPRDARIASSDHSAKIELLTPREKDVLEQLVIGRPNKVIAYELGISPRTVEIHRARVMKKMAARGLSHLVRMALESGIDPGDI